MDVSTTTNQNIYNYMNTLSINPMVFVILLVVILLYVLLFSSLGKNSTIDYQQTSGTGSGTDIKTAGIIVIIIFCVLALINGVQYFFGINVVTSITNLFSNSPQINIGINETTSDSNDSNSNSNIPESLQQQVFNIPGNKYGYNDAKTLCAAYGARLATYDDVEKSYQRGGEWCNYGWSEGQMALFPTQKVTYQNLQTISGHENDCGRPGVNGGYMANPDIKFGVNCYGHKPLMTGEEEENMMTNSPYPKTEKDILMEQRVDYWKQHLDEILVSPFNYNKWNML
uniref:Link domain-containing protein n=1 Tax=viral metagenome TaxID=1070528 RepID=A0A6C0LFE9_9ZZZZ